MPLKNQNLEDQNTFIPQKNEFSIICKCIYLFVQSFQLGKQLVWWKEKLQRSRVQSTSAGCRCTLQAARTWVCLSESTRSRNWPIKINNADPGLNMPQNGNISGEKFKLQNFRLIMIRYNSVYRANQKLVGIHNDTAHEELVKIYNRLTSWKSLLSTCVLLT